MSGKTCAGTWVKGLGKDGSPREVYLYHVVDNAWSMAEYGSQAVVWQTAINPVVALELLAEGVWSGAGVLGPEALAAQAVPRAARGVRIPLGDGRALAATPPGVSRRGRRRPCRARSSASSSRCSGMTSGGRKRSTLP